MLIIVNKLISKEAVKKLSVLGEVLLFETKEIVEDYLSGHVDLFLVRHGNNIIFAPNTPDYVTDKLRTTQYQLVCGKHSVEKLFPSCAAYNVAASNSLMIHNFKHTDPVLLDNLSELKQINVKQSMSRCSTLILNEDAVITSDAGTVKACEKYGLETLFVDPRDIFLPGQKYGLFGGCCGIYENVVVINGSLNKKTGGGNIREFIEARGSTVVELISGELMDVGSILIV